MLNKLIKKGLEIGKMLRKPGLPENKTLVGKDRLGNFYYQHYTDDGFESKRECVYHGDHYNFRKIGESSIDPFWTEWLAKRQKKPYTEEELTLLYKEYDMRTNKFKQQDQQEQKEKGYDPKEWKP